MFLDDLKKQILFIDGAMGSMVQDLNLPKSAYGGANFAMLSDLLIYSRPNELCDKIHLEYLKAGANILETNTFGASPLRLQEFDFSTIDLEDFSKLPEGLNFVDNDYKKIAWYLNYDGVKIAKKAIEKYKKLDEYDGRPLYVAGSIGPSNWVLCSTKANLNKTDFETIKDNFRQQVFGLLDADVDVLLFETQQDILELKAAVLGASEAFQIKKKRVPIIAQVTVDQFCKMQIFNTDILAAYATVGNIGIDVFGINCTIGPELMDKVIPLISKYSHLPISVVPNAGLPISVEGKTVYPLSPEDMAQYMYDYTIKYGLNIIGGCCGTRPAHIKAISKKLKDVKPIQRKIVNNNFISGPQNASPICSDKLTLIGERLNVRGSKKVREAVENEENLDLDALEEVVNEQVRDLGINIIDVCMDSNIVNTEEVLPKIIYELTSDFQGSMCIDSFSVEALLKAIEVYPGRPLINSISLEEYSEGVNKIEAIVPYTQQHTPLYIALLTDGDGPALTAKKKYELAIQIIKECSKYNVLPKQLIIDINAFPIGSESDESMNFTLESLNCLEKIKSIDKDLMTSIGVGNLTNGLAKKPYMRKILTSVFLYEAHKRGLDMAIVNPNHYVPIESLDKNDLKLAYSVIFDRDMDAFAKLEEIAEYKVEGVTKKKVDYNDLTLEEAICQKIIDGYKEKVKEEINLEKFIYPIADKIVYQMVEVIKKHKPLDFINDYLMKSMQKLGDGFGRGEVSLPHLLKSADVMKQCMNFLEQYMKNKSGIISTNAITYKGVIVIGTVYQDVHSIGKDLAKTLLENYGYRVVDLGVQVPLENFIETAIKEKADAIGMSALLVQTSNHMITVAKMMKEKSLNMPVLVGGAPVNSRHAAYVSMYGQENMNNINSQVFYCQSGMDGVNVMNTLMNNEKRSSFIEENGKKLKQFYRIATEQKIKNKEKAQALEMRKVNLINYNPPAAENNYGLYDYNLSISELKNHFDLKTLFALNWKYGSKKSWSKQGISEEKLMNTLDDWVEKASKNNWIEPKARFGIFPAQADKNKIIVYDPKDKTKKIGEFTFNTVIGRQDKWTVPQYLHTVESETMDVIGLQISTCGISADKQINHFRENGELENCFLLQGLSDRVAEDMAEQVHLATKKALNLDKKAGCRFSPGYPAMEDINNNELIFKLLKAEELGITLIDNAEFHPTSSTGAVSFFHPKISYN